MIDLDVIDAKCNEYLNSIGRSCGTILDVNEIKGLAECARKAEKDAARYRWLRDESADFERTSPLVFMADECADIVTEGDYQGIMFGEFLDCAIDEAMQCSK